MPNTYVLGKGRLFFDPFVAGLKTGERPLGNSPGFEISITSNPLEHFSSESGIQEKDDEVLLSVVRNAVINCDNIIPENLSLFVIGGFSTLSQGAGSVTNEGFTVKKGRTYQMGVTAGFPLGARNVSAVVITGTAGTPVYVSGTDYILDAVKGRFEIVVAGAIAENAVLEVDFTRAAKTWVQVASQSLTAIDGALRFIADNPKGTNRDMYAPKVTMKPNGSFQWIGENWLNMSFNTEFLKKDLATAAVFIEDTPVA